MNRQFAKMRIDRLKRCESNVNLIPPRTWAGAYPAVGSSLNPMDEDKV